MFEGAADDLLNAGALTGRPYKNGGGRRRPSDSCNCCGARLIVIAAGRC